MGNYVLNWELITLSVRSEVGGDNKILILNLKRLFVGNILIITNLYSASIFLTFGAVALDTRRLLSFLSFPSFELKFKLYVIRRLGIFFRYMHVKYKV